jgi:hypothetical protein
MSRVRFGLKKVRRFRIPIATLSAASLALGCLHADIPVSGRIPAETIRKFEEQVAEYPGIQKFDGAPGTQYMVLNPGGDSVAYFFTGPTEPAHPSMIVITVHPLEDPLQPKEHEFEFIESYAGSEAEFKKWSKQVSYDFGRGMGAAIGKAAKERAILPPLESKEPRD